LPKLIQYDFFLIKLRDLVGVNKADLIKVNEYMMTVAKATNERFDKLSDDQRQANADIISTSESQFHYTEALQFQHDRELWGLPTVAPD